MKTKHIIIGLFILLIILFLIQKKEHAGSTTPPPATAVIPNLSNEAVQNIAKVYADTNNTATFNNVNITGNLNVTGNLNILPQGTIVAFNGATAPVGWALCDGTNNTPDLRGKFILGVGKGKDESNVDLTERKIADVGGKETISLQTSNIPNHVHNMFAKRVSGDNTYNYMNTPDANTATKIVVSAAGNRGTEHSYALHAEWNNPDTTKNETWWGRTSDVGGRWKNNAMTVDPVNNMPPFYVLTYIMKI